MHHTSPLTVIAALLAIISVVLLVRFLVMRPALDRNTKISLLFGLGVFPIAAAATTNVEGYQATQKRHFCGSCHVMTPIARDSEDAKSAGLAARHARNAFTGENNCYVCHADYGMFGTVLTKMGGMRHVWLYYTEFRTMPMEEAKEKIHLLKPYPNTNCMQCHSTENPGWLAEPEHRASLEATRSGAVSCASPGCHGFAHPNMVPEKDRGHTPAQLLPRPRIDAGAAHSLGLFDGGAP